MIFDNAILKGIFTLEFKNIINYLVILSQWQKRDKIQKTYLS